MPNEIPVLFHNVSNYDYHFIIKKLAIEFEDQLECLGENKEKYKTFRLPIKKEITEIDKVGNKSVVNVSYKIKFIDSARFMASSLSNLVDNLAERIHKIKCKSNCFIEYESSKDNLINYKWLFYNKDYSNKLDEKLKNNFKNTFKVSKSDINKFILLLTKGVYPYENNDDWEKLNKTALAKKEEFYSNLNMEEITDVDYMHGKRVCKDF